MASREFEGREKGRFPGLLLAGVAMALVVIVVAFIVDSEIGIPLVILLAICAVAAVGFRVLAGSNRSDADAGDNVPKQPASESRPLGDTPEAHDEINPHDLPLEHPGRHEAEKMAEGSDQTTAGMAAGGAAGDDGPEEGSGEREPVEEAQQGAETRET